MKADMASIHITLSGQTSFCPSPFIPSFWLKQGKDNIGVSVKECQGHQWPGPLMREPQLWNIKQRMQFVFAKPEYGYDH